MQSDPCRDRKRPTTFIAWRRGVRRRLSLSSRRSRIPRKAATSSPLRCVFTLFREHGNVNDCHRLVLIGRVFLSVSNGAARRQIRERQKVAAQARQRRHITLNRRLNETALFNKRLPVELVTAIFEICCDSWRTWRVRNLLSICGVCSNWRNIATGAPVLWSTFNYRSPNALLLHLLGIHLTRSKTAPLFVEVSAHGETNTEIESVATLLRPHLWRCRLLELDFSRAPTAELFLPLPRSMPFLRYLSLTIEPTYYLPNSPNTPPVQEESKHLCLFSEDRAECELRSIQIYVPNDIKLLLPTFTNLTSLETLGLALNLPSTQMLDIATQAPQLRSLDLMVHHPEPVEQRDSRFAYPRLERQRIAGGGCTSLIAAPYLRSLTLADEASMRAVDQLMMSRPFASGGFSIGAVEPLFPQLRSLTFVFGGASDVQSNERTYNLARFIREHEQLVSLDIVAGWVPVPYLLETSLSVTPHRAINSNSSMSTYNAGRPRTAKSTSPRLPCPKLELIKLEMVLPVDLHSVGDVLNLLIHARTELKVELMMGTDFEIPDSLKNLCDIFPGRVALRTRRR